MFVSTPQLTTGKLAAAMFAYLSSAIGLILGSFFAALSWRYPRGISIAEGRSICPKCKNQIAWYDNIPLLSYLFLRGKCRNCKKHISLRYPIIEASTALGFLYLFSIFQNNIPFLFYSLTIFSLLMLIFIIDFEHRIIPDTFTFLGILVVFIYLLTTGSSLLFSNIFAGLICAFLLLLIHLMTRGRGMGLGDVKFAILGGMLTGLRLNMVWLFLAFLTGGITGIILILAQRARLKDQIAFGPFLIVAIGLTFLIGDKLLVLAGPR